MFAARFHLVTGLAELCNGRAVVSGHERHVARRRGGRRGRASGADGPGTGYLPARATRRGRRSSREPGSVGSPKARRNGRNSSSWDGRISRVTC